MTAPEIRQLAEDYLALPPGPYWFQKHVLFGDDEMVCIYEQGYSGIVEAEARRLNAMPGLLRAAVNDMAREHAVDLYLSNTFRDEIQDLALLVQQVKAHQKGESV